MERIFNSTSYAGLGLTLIFALAPGLSMIEVKGSDTLLAVVSIIYLAIFAATVVCIILAFYNKLPKAPKWFSATVLLLLIPYFSALSTAISSFGEVNSSGKYWGAICMIPIFLILPYFISWNERRKAKRQK